MRGGGPLGRVAECRRGFLYHMALSEEVTLPRSLLKPDGDAVAARVVLRWRREEALSGGGPVRP
jgi:hypothetical protein